LPPGARPPNSIRRIPSFPPPIDSSSCTSPFSDPPQATSRVNFSARVNFAELSPVQTSYPSAACR
jgi:hypothetical protein